MIRVGVAGWSYDGWNGVIYPKPAPKDFDPLPFLAGYIDTIEINSTFYHPPRPEVAERWAERIDPYEDFRFTAKLWRCFTHERDEAWSTADVDSVRSGFEPLAEAGRLGAVLVQFPWSFRRNPENREWLDDVITTFDDYPLVLEVRHASWNVPEFYEALHEYRVGVVNIDQPLFNDSIEPTARATTRVGYVRLHGRNYHDWFRESAGWDERYDYLYSGEELETWADRTREIEVDPESGDVYVVANNHYRAQAVTTALMIQSILQESQAEAPPELFEEYSEVLEGRAKPQTSGMTSRELT